MEATFSPVEETKERINRVNGVIVIEFSVGHSIDVIGVIFVARQGYLESKSFSVDAIKIDGVLSGVSSEEYEPGEGRRP